MSALMAALLLSSLSSLLAIVHGFCPQGPTRASSLSALDSIYPAENENYLCLNWTRPFPLPCEPPRNHWRPKWEGRFVVTAWWPPNPVNYKAYADAGFNMALTENHVGIWCERQAAAHGPGWNVTKDEILGVIFDAAEAMRSLGILTIASQGNGCNAWFANTTDGQVYGRAVGGSFEGRTNVTTRTRGEEIYGPKAAQHIWTVPEVEYIVGRIRDANLSDAVASIFLHDDTVTQEAEVVAVAEWLRVHAPDIVPQVNQQMGNSGTETLYRGDLFIAAPEQYPISQPNLTGGNATAMAMAQLSGYEDNARQDTRFGLDHWPLFNVGAGTGGDSVPGASYVRSDSLVRFMVNAAVAYGARGLYWYCWGGGIWELLDDDVGKPSTIYPTVREVNADAYAWGTELLGSTWNGALHSGWCSGQVGQCSRPTASSLVTSMDIDLIASLFRVDNDPSAAYIYVVDKRVSAQSAKVFSRNASLTLHPSVINAEVRPTGRPGAQLFFGVGTDTETSRRSMYSSVTLTASGALRAVVEMHGGGGALISVKLSDAFAREEALSSARDWDYPAEAASMVNGGGMQLKTPQNAYDAWNSGYRPYVGLELSSGASYLDVGDEGEQTGLILAADTHVVSSYEKAQAWSRAGFNMLVIDAPWNEDLDAWGSASRAIQRTLDIGLSTGLFVALAPSNSSAGFARGHVAALAQNYRCHTRLAGFVVTSSGTHPLSELRQSAPWLHRLARVDGVGAAITAAAAGVAVPMLLVPPSSSLRADAVARAAAVLDLYENMGANASTLAWIPSIDSCATDSDSELRLWAYAAFAFGGRGVHWRGMATCAPPGSPKFSLIASLQLRLAATGNTFVRFAAEGYEVVRLHKYRTESGAIDDSLVESVLTDDILVAELRGTSGRAANPMVYVIDTRAADGVGEAPTREVAVDLRNDIVGTQPLEGDALAGYSQCNQIRSGAALRLRLPGGSAQLVALAMNEGYRQQ